MVSIWNIKLVCEGQQLAAAFSLFQLFQILYPFSVDLPSAMVDLLRASALYERNKHSTGSPGGQF